MLKIKLSRTGKRNQPSYRFVVQEARAKRDGGVVETLGHYHPLENSGGIRLDAERYRHWVKSGAVPTDSVRHLARNHQ